jgi:hypothetical protein
MWIIACSHKKFCSQCLSVALLMFEFIFSGSTTGALFFFLKE